MSRHIVDRITLDDFAGMLVRLVMIGAIVLIAYILVSGSFR